MIISFLMVNSIKVFETLVTSSNKNCTLPWEIRQHNQFMITVKSLQVCGINNFLWRSALLLNDKLILADIIMCSTNLSYGYIITLILQPNFGDKGSKFILHAVCVLFGI